MDSPSVKGQGKPTRLFKSRRNQSMFHFLKCITCITLLFTLIPFLRPYFELNFCFRSLEQNVQKCSIERMHQNLSFLESAKPINTSEFLQRRDKLATALSAAHIDAFAVEPGYTFQYYANISQPDWEPWEPEERPFLMLIMPYRNPQSGKVSARTVFLSPKFEEGRVRMLGIPWDVKDGEMRIITYEEHWDPYRTLVKELSHVNGTVRIMVDEEMRDFISRGLSGAGFKVSGLSDDVAAVKQTKSPAEVEVLRAVNTGTVEAIRAVRSCLVAGLTENQVIQILDNTLLSVPGFSLFFNIVLFDDNAALPHGGFKTGDKVLEQDTMVLIDVGAHYLGYSSDVSRSFFIPLRKGFRETISKHIPFFRNIVDPRSDSHREKVNVWHLVRQAQKVAAARFTPNNTAADVDLAAREFIKEAGYGDMKHRVGHGIGIKAHEAPYLNQANKQKLRPGMTFTNEPGIYLEEKFGVRHEDVYLVKETGEAEVLSGREASGPYDP